MTDAAFYAFVNARLVDPVQERDEIGGLLIQGDRIVDSGPDIIIPDEAETLDCTGLTLLPGLVDMQVFTGEPGEEHRETLAVGVALAAEVQ